MGPGFIPSAAIILYLEKVKGETDPSEFDRAIRMVGAIDDEYLASREKPSQPE